MVNFRWFSIILIVAILARFIPVKAQEGSDILDAYTYPGERAVTLQQGMNYNGRIFNIHYFTTGDYSNTKGSFLDALNSKDAIERNQITGVLVTADGKLVEDEDTLRDVLSLYRSCHYLYQVQPSGPLGNVDDQFVDQMSGLSKLTRFLTLSFPTREESTAEALRGIFTSQLDTPGELESMGDNLRENLEQGKTITDSVRIYRDSHIIMNEPMVGKTLDAFSKTFASYLPQDGLVNDMVKIENKLMYLSNALHIFSLAIRMIWIADLQGERADWLEEYLKYAKVDAAFDQEQLDGASLAIWETNSDRNQRAEIFLVFIRDKGIDLTVRWAAKEIAKDLVEKSWTLGGKRIAGHAVVGAASSVLLGVAIGNLLYGLDDVHENFSIGVRADELRRRFKEGRLALQQQVANQSFNYYDGNLCDQYQAAYMLESLSASRMYRYYSDGVDATMRSGLSPIVLINWLAGRDWRKVTAELRQIGIQVESEAEETIGHPLFINAAIQMVSTREMQSKLTVDDSSARFKRSGQADYWRESPGGFAGQHTWTLNENNKMVNSGRWTPVLEQAGAYRVEAYIPQSSDGSIPITSSAMYVISHIGLSEEVSKKQSSASGNWLDLGIYYFEGGGNEYVELVDETRESSGTSSVVYDAVRWTAVDNSENAYNASSGSGFIYDVVLPGETATLEFQVVNSGFKPWEAGLTTFAPDPMHIDKSLRSFNLPNSVLPSETVGWTVEVPGYTKQGMQTIRYRMMLSGEPFGDVISGYVFVLPEQFQDYQDDLRQKIDEWKAQGEDKVEDLIATILAEIQNEIEKQAMNALDGLLTQCQSTAMVLVLGAMIPFYVKRKRRSRKLSGHE